MSVRGVHRGIHSSLLDDPDYQQLSADGRLVLLTVRLCKQAGPAVIFRYYTELVAAQTGLAVRRVTAALAELTRTAWVEMEGPVLWVRNGLRYDPSMRLADRKHRLSVERAVAELPRLNIVLRFCDYYEIARPFEGPSKGVTGLALRIPNTEEDRIPNTESRALAAPAPPLIQFQIPDSIQHALGRCPILGAIPRLQQPAWWQAQIRANGRRGIDFAAEVLNAEAWLTTNPDRAPRKDHAGFLHRWLKRAEAPHV